MSTKTNIDKTLEGMRAFVKIWNDTRAYPANYDLERRFGAKVATIRARGRRYEEYRRKHPEHNLPPLVIRRLKTGGWEGLPPGVLEQLDPFRIPQERVLTAHTLVVTAAQFGAPLNRTHWQALVNFSNVRAGCLVVLPIKYGPIKTVYHQETGTYLLTSTFPNELKRRMLFDDLLLARGELMLNVSRLRPTLERFLTDTICEMGGPVSQIFGAPKLELEHRPRVGHRYPKAIMTTGACTHPNYANDPLGQQDRTGTVATTNHTYAAVVVEIDGKEFHFRQLLADKKGRFYDINPVKGGAEYFTDKGVEQKPDDVEVLICGDWHTGKTCPTVRKATFGHNGMTDRLKPNHVVLHDSVDTDSASKHDQKQATRRAFKAPLKWDSLEEELVAHDKELAYMHKRTKAQLHVIASNHNGYTAEYIDLLSWAKDDANLYIGAKLFVAMVEDLRRRLPKLHKAEASPIDPVVWWIRQHSPFALAYERQDMLVLPKGKDGILLSLHGDKGVRGSESRSTKEYRKLNHRVTLGHNHSATILGPVWRVGTSTPLMQFYVSMPMTNWTNTHQVIYRKKGQRQLINIINGRWYGRKAWDKYVKQSQ